MDDFFIHLAPLYRRFPSGLPVQSAGYVPRKTSRVRHAFKTFNFSLVLSGRGVYHFRGERFEVEGPFMITQWPDVPMDYGPADGGAWEEFFVIYEAGAMEELARRGLASPHKPAWPIRRETEVREQFAHLRALLPHAAQGGMADRLDRACEQLIVETRLAEHRPPAGREEEAVRRIRRHIRERPFSAHDFDALARANGLSSATFRRYWNRYVHEPPARYVMALRMREARRLLAETDLGIAEIARRVGFEDPLHFSRRFHRMVGAAPTTYRTRFQR